MPFGQSRPSYSTLASRLPPFSVTTQILLPSQLATNTAPLLPTRMVRASLMPLANTSTLKPFGTLIFLTGSWSSGVTSGGLGTGARACAPAVSGRPTSGPSAGGGLVMEGGALGSSMALAGCMASSSAPRPQAMDTPRTAFLEMSISFLPWFSTSWHLLRARCAATQCHAVGVLTASVRDFRGNRQPPLFSGTFYAV